MNKSKKKTIDLSIVIPSYGEQDNLKKLLPKIKFFASRCTPAFEIIVIEGTDKTPTQKVCRQYGAQCLKQASKGFGGAIKEGFQKAAGAWVCTIDADGSHNPGYIPILWRQRYFAELVIASRYIPGAFSDQNYFRSTMNRLLNNVARWCLDLPFKDISGGYKLYKKSMLNEFQLQSKDSNIQIESVVRAYAFGFKIKEIPFHFHERMKGNSKAHIIHYAFSLLTSIFKLWRMRNSVYFADYDLRAFQSRLLPQRIWHQRRYDITSSLMEDVDATLEVGCGTGRMFFGHPEHIGVDIDFRKIRFLNQYDYAAITANATSLPFADGSFEQVICQEVVEHSPNADKIIMELHRVLSSEGTLILSTPDYSKKSLWPFIEKWYAKLMPNAYAEEHITHYTEKSLCMAFEKAGFKITKIKKAFSSILHVKAVKTRNE